MADTSVDADDFGVSRHNIYTYRMASCATECATLGDISASANGHPRLRQAIALNLLPALRAVVYCDHACAQGGLGPPFEARSLAGPSAPPACKIGLTRLDTVHPNLLQTEWCT
jgi:hypothetical protein